MFAFSSESKKGVGGGRPFHAGRNTWQRRLQRADKLIQQAHAGFHEATNPVYSV